ncbi:hypothetical protein GCM10017559_71880 [Streptosporangium longisporum]|uniref:Uncharacterized protein n=1 Tax=Streptosporangium longisporum TaxID=46187 RepID=A0ABP6L981_9ACTN
MSHEISLPPGGTASLAWSAQRPAKAPRVRAGSLDDLTDHGRAGIESDRCPSLMQLAGSQSPALLGPPLRGVGLGGLHAPRAPLALYR